MLANRTSFSLFTPVIKQKDVSSGHCSTQLWSQHSLLQHTNSSNSTLHWRGVFHLCRLLDCHNKAWECLTDAWRAAGRLCSWACPPSKHQKVYKWISGGWRDAGRCFCSVSDRTPNDHPQLVETYFSDIWSHVYIHNINAVTVNYRISIVFTQDIPRVLFYRSRS